MPDTSLANQEYRLWVRLHQARDAIYKAREKALKQFGISTMESAVLFSVKAIGSRATPAEISRWIFREPHSVVGILNRMERKGLVRRAKDLDKKNQTRVMITEKGQQAYYQAAKIKSVSKIMSTISGEERQQLRSCLQKLRAAELKELGVECELPFLQYLVKSNI